MRKYNTFFISTGLSLFALIVALTMKTTHFYMCAVAMATCTLGDIILANFYGFKVKFPFPILLSGALVFMVGHVGYVIAFIVRMREYGYAVFNKGFGIGTLIVVSSYLALMYFAKKKKGITVPKAIIWAIYFIFVGTNVCTTIAFAWSHGGLVWIRAFGALCFFISDYLIGIDRLVGGPKYRLQQGIWGFYPVGQLLLLLPI